MIHYGASCSCAWTGRTWSTLSDAYDEANGHAALGRAADSGESHRVVVAPRSVATPTPSGVEDAEAAYIVKVWRDGESCACHSDDARLALLIATAFATKRLGAARRGSR